MQFSFLKGKGKNRRELIFTTDSAWGREAVEQRIPESAKKSLSMEILEKKELMLLHNDLSSYHR